MAEALPQAGGEVESRPRDPPQVDALEESRYLAAKLSQTQEELHTLKAKLATEEEERKKAELLKDHWKVRCLSQGEPRIMSPVITSTDKWYEVTWLLVHEPIRQAVEQLEAVFGNEVMFDPVAHPWKRDVFFQWLAHTFWIYMDRHYSNLDHRYIPWIAERAQVPGRERYQETHASIMASLDKLKHMATDFNLKNAATAEERAAFVGHWTAQLRGDVLSVCGRLKQSMDEEERDLPPLVAQHFSEQEEAKQIELMAWTGTGEAHIELSMMVAGLEAWATPEAREAILARRLSPVGRWTLETYWLPTFKGRNLFLLQSLALEAEAQPTSAVPLVGAYWLTVAVPAVLICSIQ